VLWCLSARLDFLLGLQSFKEPLRVCSTQRTVLISGFRPAYLICSTAMNHKIFICVPKIINHFIYLAFIYIIFLIIDKPRRETGMWMAVCGHWNIMWESNTKPAKMQCKCNKAENSTCSWQLATNFLLSTTLSYWQKSVSGLNNPLSPLLTGQNFRAGCYLF
jgi:hypothetical protein